MMAGNNGKYRKTIRRGDVWDFNTGDGHIIRAVRSVSTMGIVYYISAGEMRRCTLYSFQRWAYGAELTSAENWDNRT